MNRNHSNVRERKGNNNNYITNDEKESSSTNHLTSTHIQNENEETLISTFTPSRNWLFNFFRRKRSTKNYYTTKSKHKDPSALFQFQNVQVQINSYFPNKSKRRTQICISIIFIITSFLSVKIFHRSHTNSPIDKSTQKDLQDVKIEQNGSILKERQVKSADTVTHQEQDSSIVIKNSEKLNDHKKKEGTSPDLYYKEEIDENDRMLETQYIHQHAIPNVIIFTHVLNLLSPSQPLIEDEDKVLSQNVQNTISLHEQSTVRFLTDKECIQSIQNIFPSSDAKKAKKLIEYFLKESEGMYKADLCRGAALYETGGLYFDVDIQARMSIWEVLKTSTEFVTVKVHSQSKHPTGFFQAFIGVTKRHPMMKKYVEYFLEYYEGTRKVNGPLGVLLLRDAFEDHYHSSNAIENHLDKEKMHIDDQEQYIDEEENDRLELKEVELWQEIRYHPLLFPNVESPVGERRACHFMVAIPWKVGVAPFYSRVRGSRMCGGKDSNK